MSCKSDMVKNFTAVTCISNPVRWKSRPALYKRFAQVMQEAGVNLITVEMAFGERPFEVTERDNPNHVQVRSVDELWHKENLINLGINYAIQQNPDVEYLAWIDADVLPMRPASEWIRETCEALQHYHVVQMFKHAQQLDPNGNIYGKPWQSFMSVYHDKGFELPNGLHWSDSYYSSQYGHPGFAWAATREALNNLGGPIGGPLIEFSVLGSGDLHMCLGLLGQLGDNFGYDNPTYQNALKQWQLRAERWVKRDVGYVPGGIYHMWHGNRRDRQYVSRWKILADNKFDPLIDLTRDAQGLLKLETWDDRQIKLRDQIRAYFRSRNEDSVDV